MKASFCFFAAAIAVVAAAVPFRADAKTISINFYDSGFGDTSLAPTDIAGVIAAPRWNNVDRLTGSVVNPQSREVTVSSGSLVDSANTSTNVSMKWAAAFTNSLEKQTGGPSANHTMMSSGGRTVQPFDGNHISQIELSGLLSDFAPGYQVYLYYGRGNDDNAGFRNAPNTSFHGGWGDIIVTGAGTYTADMSDVPGSPVATVGFQTLENNLAINFDGAFVLSNSQTVMGNYSTLGGLGLDILTLTFNPVTGSGDAAQLGDGNGVGPEPGFPFDTFNLLGLQIVGDAAETNAVPEPSTYALGLIGLAGLALAAAARQRAVGRKEWGDGRGNCKV